LPRVFTLEYTYKYTVRKGASEMTRLLTIGQVAKVLVKAEKTVYNYLESGVLDCGFKIGHEWRVTEEDLWDWIKRQRMTNGVVPTAR